MIILVLIGVIPVWMLFAIYGIHLLKKNTHTQHTHFFGGEIWISPPHSSRLLVHSSATSLRTLQLVLRSSSLFQLLSLNPTWGLAREIPHSNSRFQKSIPQWIFRKYSRNGFPSGWFSVGKLNKMPSTNPGNCSYSKSVESMKVWKPAHHLASTRYQCGSTYK